MAQPAQPVIQAHKALPVLRVLQALPAVEEEPLVLPGQQGPPAPAAQVVAQPVPPAQQATTA